MSARRAGGLKTKIPSSLFDSSKLIKDPGTKRSANPKQRGRGRLSGCFPADASTQSEAGGLRAVGVARFSTCMVRHVETVSPQAARPKKGSDAAFVPGVPKGDVPQFGDQFEHFGRVVVH